jgi:alpha-glucosidase
MYYGEELGAENNDPKKVEDVFDPIGKIGWPKEKGRDGERTPMQWDASEHAGFSTAKPWLKPPASYVSHNVAVESKEDGSILNFYKNLTVLRRKEPFKSGCYEAINTGDDQVFAYLRKDGAETVLVALNFSDKEQNFKPEIPGLDFAKARKVMLAQSGVKNIEPCDDVLHMEPFGVAVTSLAK